MGSSRVTHLTESEVLKGIGEDLTARQVATLHGRYRPRGRKAGPGLVVDARWERESNDLVLEWLPRWRLIDQRVPFRTGDSYVLRIHPNGHWCLLEESGGHHPRHCPRCRDSAEMLAPLNAYPAMAAPVDMSSEQLLGYWSSLLSGGRPFLVSDSAVPEGDLEGYEYWTKARRQAALKREQSLVMAFCRYLERNGRKFTSKTIRLESGTITCDVFDETRQILFEAKSSASDRAQLRMAIGQLYDYGYFGFDAPIRMAVLVPDKPAPDTVELLNHLGIGVAWQVSATMFEEVEP